MGQAVLALSGSFGAVHPAYATPALDGYEPERAATAPAAGRSFFPPLTPPLSARATYRYELGREAWALEQLLTFANVSATIRTIVVRMKDGGLWVDGPQYPTGEYCRLLDELGPVKHVVLPCSALEHKAPMAPFVKRYPKASVWVSPGQVQAPPLLRSHMLALQIGTRSVLAASATARLPSSATQPIRFPVVVWPVW